MEIISANSRILRINQFDTEGTSVQGDTVT